MLSFKNQNMVINGLNYCSKPTKKISKYPNLLTEIYMDIMIKNLRIELDALKKDIDTFDKSTNETYKNLHINLKSIDTTNKLTNKINKNLRADLESIKKDIDAYNKNRRDNHE